MPLRIAILECDTPLPNTRSQYGGYGGVFTALLTAGAHSISLNRSELHISTWDVVDKQEYPSLDDVDAVLMTGSKYDSFADIPWINRLVEFTQQILAQDCVRIIGVCFGHQIVGRAMGVKVGRSNWGWEVSVCEVELTAKGKELFGKDKLSINQMHKDIVFTYPPEVEPLGSSPRCEVQGMLIPKRVITIQGHPEFNAEIVAELLEARHKQGIFDEKTYEDAIQRVGKEQDGVLVSGVFLKFLLDQL
ncbi:hypothetical protein MMC34_003835 [Xylographa carneopallida]|nr:hypothetical protein [Xylographa carneopallida]